MKKFLLVTFLLFLSTLLYSQNSRLTYNGSGNYTLRERTDLRRYDNGKYVGLVSREVTSFITPVSFEDGYMYEGSFFLHEDTMRAARNVTAGLRNSIPSVFKIDSEGKFKMIEDNGYPSFRSFPTYPEKAIHLGDTWTGKAERAIDPLNKGIVTKIPVVVQYKYTGDEYFHGEPVYLISAQWATRYGMGTGNYYIDWGGDKELEKATGSHKATIYVSKITGNMLVMRDSVDETFVFTDGNSIQFKGSIALFTEYPPSYDKEDLIPALKRICELTDEEADDLIMPDLSGAVALAETGNVVTQADFEQQSGTLTEPVSVEIDTLEQAKIERKRRQEELTKRVRAYSDKNKSGTTNKNQIFVEPTPAGIRLSIQNLQFKANSSELLPGEEERLNQIAEVLKTVPNQQLLVEGHTASTGNPNGEKQLSVERAESIAAALTKRGIKSERFICKGFGGTKPIADNSTAEGKARNRRVEITILD